MASPAAVLSVLVKADGIVRTNSQLQTLHGDLGKSSKAATRMGDDLDKGSRKGSKALGALKSGAGLAIGALGAVGLAGAVKSAVSEFEEARKVGANTNQVLKSTGGVANVSAKHVANLATSISKKVGVDDEAIQSGSNLLLTFKNIRNETGKGRDVFDQATKAAVDLSAAGFGDLSTTSKQLGKALNDPVKGMTALGRSGVTFSDDQKKAIEALLNTGKAADRVKAQQIILKEVQSQVGGQAAAQATTMDKLKVTLGNLAEAAGAVLVPALDKIGKFLVVVINQMIEGKGAGGAIVSTFKSVGGAIGDLIAIGAGLIAFFKENKTLTIALAAAVGVFAVAYTATLIPALIASTAAIIAQVAAWVALRIAFLASPIGLVVVALAALAAGLVIAYRESETFRNFVNAAWAVIKTVAAWLITAGVAAFNALAAAVKTAWGAIKTVTNTVWGWLKTFLVPLWELFKTLISTYFNGYKTVVTNAWNAIKTVTSTVWNAIKTVATTVWGLIKTAAGVAWDGIRLAVLTPIRAARDVLGTIWDKISSVAGTAWDNMKTNLGKWAGAVKDAVLSGIKGGLNALIGFINAVIGVINKIPGVPNIGKIDKLAEGGTVSKSGVQGLAEGGIVRKPIVMMGEEAPRHPEYVIPTNPAYRGRAQMLLAQAAGAIGYQTGGIFNTQEMSDLWRSKGGSASLADTMGVIGLVESGGNPKARNPSGASGLWQILGQLVPGNIFNPGVNALNAIAKYKAQGLGAWDASKSKWGPLIGKTVGPDLSPGKLIGMLPGVGDLPDWLKGTGKWLLGHVGDWIKKTVSSVIPGGGGGTSAGPAGIGTFEGLPMANWVIGALKHARAKGFTGHPTSGYRSHAQNVAAGRNYFSEHEGTRYPHGAVDFGGFHSGLATKLAAVAATADYKYPLLAPIGFSDDGHASGTGHKMGGILGQGAPFVGSYARGGVVPQDGFGYLHQGETVSPRGTGGPLVHIEHMEIRQETDVARVARSLAWQLETGMA